MLEAFRRSPDSLLIPRPNAPMLTPYDYFTTNNLDPSYVSQPRLLVLKLLPLSWCELRTYFDVYAGLPRLVRTPRMALGSDYHKTLEDGTHSAVELAAVEKAVAAVVSQLPELQQAYVNRGSPMALKLAHQWVEQILVRALVVAYTGEARELHVHGYIDLAQAELVTAADRLLSAVLVNGIADVVRIEPAVLEPGIPWDPYEVRHLTRELSGAKVRMDAFARHHTLQVRDVKTRQYNSVPRQALVVAAARDQCMYYLQFLTTLAHSPQYGYACLMESLARREVDGYSPLAEVGAVVLLVTHFGVLVNDYLALACGDDFAKLGGTKDRQLQVQSEGHHAASAYSLASVMSEADFRSILAAFHGNRFDKVDVGALFKPWKIALTPAHLSERAAHALHLFEHLEPASVCVEYHNVRTQRIIEVKQFEFEREILAARTREAAEFWRGTRQPVGTTDRERCKSCHYRSRCPSLNEPGERKSSVGDVIADFVAEAD